MQIKHVTSSGVMLLLLFLFCAAVFGQQKKMSTSKNETVCSAKLPSRASMISSSRKPVTAPPVCTKKNLSCCKGTPSRFTTLASANTKAAKPVNKN